jgi:8-hydroxy-5-deazaflavin:NADPH oxidoreductase
VAARCSTLTDCTWNCSYTFRPPKPDPSRSGGADTNNDYPDRDGHFEELDSDRTTSSELLQQHLADARVVKAFNAIYWEHLRDYGRPAGDPARIGIPVSGDDEHAKRTVAQLIDQIGFDAVDAGTLAEGGPKHQPGSPVHAADLPTDELRARLTA